MFRESNYSKNVRNHSTDFVTNNSYEFAHKSPIKDLKINNSNISIDKNVIYESNLNHINISKNILSNNQKTNPN